MKPVKMWAVVSPSGVFMVSHSKPKGTWPDERIVRVEVREVKPKKKRKANGKA